jgi:hypothetical protein
MSTCDRFLPNDRVIHERLLHFVRQFLFDLFLLVFVYLLTVSELCGLGWRKSYLLFMRDRITFFVYTTLT